MTPSDADKIPLPLRESSQWVGWRLGTRNGKPTKEPIDPATGRLAAVNQPRTRGSFDAARSAVSRFRLSGVGYVFTAGDPYVGIDLDKCRDSESGVIEPWAQEIIDQLQSYTEVSQSGTGVHIIVRGALPPDVRGGRRCDRIECYSHSRYFIMTGAHLDGTPTTIEERTIELAAFYQAHFNTGPRSTVSLSQDDAALIEEAMLAANGKKFDQSWRGDWQAGGYPSQSEADLALCERLAFLTGKHHARIDRLFRKSGLMRPKWDEKHYSDGRTYGEGTIDAALRLCTESVGTKPSTVGQPETDPGITKRLADAITADTSFARDAGDHLYVFERGVYRPHGTNYVFTQVKEILLSLEQTKKWSSHRASEVAKYILADAQRLWERPPLDTLNLANGLLDVNTRVLRPHDPSFLFPVQLPPAYKAEATCPAWERFIAEVFPADSRRLAYELVAYLMLPDMTLRKAILFIGTGRNGKSTFLRGVTAFLGHANVAALSLHRLETDRFAMARLLGMLASICPDLPSEALTSTSVFKGLVGGDAQEAERKFQDSFLFIAYCRLVFSANHYPRSQDSSEAFFDRWHTLEFSRRFEGEDARDSRVLDAELADPDELSGLLNKALGVLPGLRQHGFTETASSRAAAREFRDMTDPLATWLTRCTVEEFDALVSAKDLLISYNADAETNGRPHTNKTAMGYAMKRLRPSVLFKKKAYLGEMQGCYIGLRLKPDLSKEEPPEKTHEEPPEQERIPGTGLWEREQGTT